MSCYIFYLSLFSCYCRLFYLCWDYCRSCSELSNFSWKIISFSSFYFNFCPYVFRLFDRSSFVLVCLLSSYIVFCNLPCILLFICYNYSIFFIFNYPFSTILLIIPSLPTTSAYKLSALFTSVYFYWFSCNIVYYLDRRSVSNFDIVYLLSFSYLWSCLIFYPSFVAYYFLFLLSCYQSNFNSDILFPKFCIYWSLILIY